MVITHSGRLGLVPIGTKLGDSIVNFEGIWRPFVLRRWKTLTDKDETRFELIGTCYVDGLQGVGSGDVACTMFTLM